MERLSRDIERKYERLPKRLGGLSEVPLTTYLDQLGYTGLYLGTLRLGSDLWWLLLEGVCNPKGKPWTSCLLHTSSTRWLERGVAPAAAHHAKQLGWRVAVRVVTYGRVVWVIDSFAPYKSPGMDGIFLALL
jgi:hypothetical protein